MVEKNKYKITLEKVGIKCIFETNEISNVLECWKNKDNLIVTKPNGNIFAYRLAEFVYLEIEDMELSNN